MRISDWSSDVCSSDLVGDRREGASAKQRNPVIIGAHVHAALIGADFRWYVIGWFGQFQHFIRRFDFRTVQAIHRAPNHISLMLPAGYRPIMVAKGLRRRFSCRGPAAPAPSERGLSDRQRQRLTLSHYSTSWLPF